MLSSKLPLIEIHFKQGHSIRNKRSILTKAPKKKEENRITSGNVFLGYRVIGPAKCKFQELRLSQRNHRREAYMYRAPSWPDGTAASPAARRRGSAEAWPATWPPC